jgi:hypothetical protein
MKKTLTLVLMIFSLLAISCGSGYYKSGLTQSQMEWDLYECKSRGQMYASQFDSGKTDLGSSIGSGIGQGIITAMEVSE